MLVMKRFCGEEFYPVKSSEWYILESAAEDNPSLEVELEFFEGTNLSEDVAEFGQEPYWELRFAVKDESVLQKGAVLTNENEDEEDAMICYFEWEPTFHNVLEILDRNGDKLLLKITAECCDVNYYDGSKGNDQLEFTAWVDKRK